MPTIDPLRLAQFMVLPGAAELVEAFASLPPGEVRDSAVSHVQVLARATGWNPATFTVENVATEAMATNAVATPPPRLQSPFAEGLRATSAEGQIVERALRGEADHVIAADLGVPLGLVVQIKRNARAEGGVEFPGDTHRNRPRPEAKGRKGKKKRIYMLAPSPPPWWWENPDSPVWENRFVLPTRVAKVEGSMGAIGPHDRVTYSTMANTAARHGMTLRQYIAQRLEIVRRVEEGALPVPLAIEMRIAPHVVYGVLSGVGRNRMAVIAAAAQEAAEKTAQGEDEPPGSPTYPPEAQSPPTGSPEARGPVPGSSKARSAQTAKMMAAVKWGFPSLEEYETARERVRALRYQGVRPALIAIQMRQPINFVKNAIDYWQREGVKWPHDLRGLHGPHHDDRAA